MRVLIVAAMMSLCLLGGCHRRGLARVREDSPLHQLAQEAKLSGRDRVRLDPGIEVYARVRSFAEAASVYRIVVAELIEAKTVADGRQLNTWFLFRELLVLHAPPVPKDVAFDYPRQDLGVPEPGSFVASLPGGTVAVDGVTVTSATPGVEDLQVGRRYLLFVLPDASGRVARFQLGPEGVFRLSDGDALVPVTESRSSFVEDVRRLGSVERVSAALRAR